MEKTYLSVKQAAEYTGYSIGYLYKLIAANALPHYAPNGGRIILKIHEIDDWISLGKRRGSKLIQKLR